MHLSGLYFPACRVILVSGNSNTDRFTFETMLCLKGQIQIQQDSLFFASIQPKQARSNSAKCIYLFWWQSGYENKKPAYSAGFLK
jgi:hypothetical protein